MSCYHASQKFNSIWQEHHPRSSSSACFLYRSNFFYVVYIWRLVRIYWTIVNDSLSLYFSRGCTIVSIGPRGILFYKTFKIRNLLIGIVENTFAKAVAGNSFDNRRATTSRLNFKLSVCHGRYEGAMHKIFCVPIEVLSRNYREEVQVMYYSIQHCAIAYIDYREDLRRFSKEHHIT